MTDGVGAAVLLVAGAALGLMVLFRIWSGRSYFSNPPGAISRDGDPFSFWLSILFPAVIAIALTALGGLDLYRDLIVR